MKAIVQERYGAPADVLALREVDEPVVAAGQVLVAVRAAGVDAGIWHSVRGEAYIARLVLGLRRPKATRVGRDLAGVVVAVGPGVTRFRPGDEVFGECDAGSYAERAVVKEDHLQPKPANLSFEEAAALPISGRTALQGIRDAGRVHKGQKVLVVGASGGVGHYAVQIAKWLGAEVTGVCGPTNVDLVRSLGADHVLDHRSSDYTTAGIRYDVILDLIGDKPINAVRRALAPRGTLVLSAGDGGKWTGPMLQILRGVAIGAVVRQRVVPLVANRSLPIYTVLRELAETGTLRPVIERTYPLADTAAAVAHLETGRTKGKVVVTG